MSRLWIPGPSFAFGELRTGFDGGLGIGVSCSGWVAHVFRRGGCDSPGRMMSPRYEDLGHPTGL